MLKTSRDTDTYRRVDTDAQYILTTAVYIAKKNGKRRTLLKRNLIREKQDIIIAFFCKIMKFLYVARTI